MKTKKLINFQLLLFKNRRLNIKIMAQPLRLFTLITLVGSALSQTTQHLYLVGLNGLPNQPGWDFSRIVSENPSDVTNLTITNTKIVSNDYSDLYKFKNLESIDLENLINAPNVTGEFFQNFHRLKRFIVKAFDIRHRISIEDGAIKYAPHLETLEVQRSPRRNLTRGFLGYGPELLRLAHNDGNLTAIHMGAFQGLENLQILELVNNGNITLAKGAFENLKKLSHLHLDKTNITNFSWELFDGLVNLGHLSLGNLRPEEIVLGEMTKFLPPKTSVTIYVDSCFDYKSFYNLSKMNIQIVKYNEVFCY